jgi:hypothetical protein
MPLLKPRAMTPARLAANRQNALKSTGPRTARGKAQSRINGLRRGGRSPLYRNFVLAVLDTPCPVEKMVRAYLTPAEAAHPLFAEFVEAVRWADNSLAEEYA